MKTKILSFLLSVVIVVSTLGIMTVSADTAAECYWQVSGSSDVTYGTFAEAVTAANAVAANGAITITIQNDVGTGANTGYQFKNQNGGVTITINSVNGAGFVGAVGINSSANHKGTIILNEIDMEHSFVSNSATAQPFLFSRGANATIIANDCSFHTASGGDNGWGHIGVQQSGKLELNDCTVTADGNVSNTTDDCRGVFFFSDANAGTIRLNNVTVNTPNNENPFIKEKKAGTHNISLYNVKYDGADGDFDTNNAISMIDGASVRTVEGSDGMRFSSNVSKAAIEAGGDSYVMGTNFYTGDAIDSSKLIGTLIATNGIVNNDDGSKRINAVLSGITDMNATYSAQSFIKYTVGTIAITVNSKFNTLNNTRSMSAVANAALDDLSDTKTGIHQFEVTVDNVTKYSPYSSTQYEAIKGYIN